MLLEQDESPKSLVAEALGSGYRGFWFPRLMTCRGPILSEQHFILSATPISTMQDEINFSSVHQGCSTEYQ